QGSYMSGYVTMLIRGDRPELFFQKCAEKGLTVRNIHKINADECKGCPLYTSPSQRDRTRTRMPSFAGKKK
ncbi:sporulation protein YqfD, partial [Salmonella enterica]|uniref:sporulation protein YqfD n=1 Tax=Salmonella enterica TaxID=28901 RepID=UPI0014825B5A